MIYILNLLELSQPFYWMYEVFWSQIKVYWNARYDVLHNNQDLCLKKKADAEAILYVLGEQGAYNQKVLARVSWSNSATENVL